MDAVNLTTVNKGIEPTASSVGANGNLLPGAESLDPKTKTWNVWDGKNWQPVPAPPLNQAQAAGFPAAAKAEVMLR